MHMRSRILLTAATLLALCAPSLGGDFQRPAGVVELFTSQGCSSCPPADHVLDELASSGDVIALGYHVDYWDYLGWKDTLGSPENTKRQYQYGKSLGERSVYTPQAVINGSSHVNGGKRSAVLGAIGKTREAGGLPIGIAVSEAGDSIIINTDAAPNQKGNAHLVLVYFDSQHPVVIQRGENRGKTINYANPVTDIQTAGMWHGKAASFEFPKSEILRKGGCAVLLQSVRPGGLPGPILGAAMIGQPAS
jgi:hypothetical protein